MFSHEAQHEDYYVLKAAVQQSRPIAHMHDRQFRRISQHITNIHLLSMNVFGTLFSQNYLYVVGLGYFLHS